MGRSRYALLGAGCFGIAAIAAIAGAIFDAAHHGTSLSRSVAYALWFAAAFCLVLVLPAGSKRLWRSTSLPVVEGWMLVSASVFLTVLGAAVDAAGN